MTKLLTVTLFFIIMFISFQVTKPEPITSNFTEEAPRFYVLGLIEGKYEMVRLTESSKKKYNFHLDKEKVILDVGDIHIINVIEDSEGKQKIEFNYSNTYMSESVYEVSENIITPIKYRIVSSMGHGIIYLINFIISIMLAKGLSRLLIWLWNKRGK